MRKSLVDEFNEKIDKEYEAFIQKMKKFGPDKIIDKAYEISIIQIMKDIIKNKFLWASELKILLKCDNILEKCYEEWIDIEEDFGDVIESAIDKKIENLEDEEDNVDNLDDDEE